MFIILSPTLQLKALYLQLRGSVYYFYIRVPSELVDRYGKSHICQSLRTKDPHVATRKAAERFRECSAQWQALRGDRTLTPAETVSAGTALAREWGDLSLFVENVVDPKLHRYADKRGLQAEPDIYRLVEEREFLSPVELEALKHLKSGRSDARRLSDAFDLYVSAHKRSHDEAFVEKVRRDWNGLIAVVGNLHVADLSREHARAYVTRRAAGVKTATVRRSLNHVSAVIHRAWIEWGIERPNPFSSLPIPSEGNDSDRRKVPSNVEVRDIVTQWQGDDSTIALLIRLQVLTGARVGELAGLARADVVLDAEVPHIVIAERPWRTLKSKSSARRVPLVGVALNAAQIALGLSSSSAGLFEQYARERGADAASAAVNKRVRRWGVTSHSFRHWVKDALREANCPKDIRDAIQGHAARDIADLYGQGHSLKTMQFWLAKLAETFA